MKVDNARGFLPLIDGKDPDLQKLEISLSMTDPFNKNENISVIPLRKPCIFAHPYLSGIDPI